MDPINILVEGVVARVLRSVEGDIVVGLQHLGELHRGDRHIHLPARRRQAQRHRLVLAAAVVVVLEAAAATAVGLRAVLALLPELGLPVLEAFRGVVHLVRALASAAAQVRRSAWGEAARSAAGCGTCRRTCVHW